MHVGHGAREADGQIAKDEWIGYNISLSAFPVQKRELKHANLAGGALLEPFLRERQAVNKLELDNGDVKLQSEHRQTGATKPTYSTRPKPKS